ncbi:MAG: ATP-binding protein [Candidatus Omnitrophota bacterium]|jgi:AAA+ superfamily predicted ATPase
MDAENRTITNDQLAINNDQEYVESYFSICDLFREKRIIMNRLKSLTVMDRKEPLDIEKIRQLEEGLKALNVRLKERDSTFWEMVKNSLGKGKGFALEDFFKVHCLDVYDKRIFLFFLYLEFCHADENECLEQDLSEIFDFENSLYERIRSFRHYDVLSPLVEQGIIIKDFKRIQGSAAANFLLSSKGIYLAVSLLNGGKKALELNSKKVDYSDCDKIGHVKDPEYSLDEVILNDKIKEKVLFLLKTSSDKNLDVLGVSQKIKKGKGLTFLFYGPPGTGKSMLAEAVAAKLKKKLLIVEFPKLTSRWYGETDKALSKIFTEAKKNNLVVCIDEADTLLYNRNFAAQEHDIRFVNIMLQEIENFAGEMILTTNMDNLLDPALERRVTLKVNFELPDEKMRAQIWRSLIPDKVTIAEGIDFLVLANQFSLSGGYIKNAVLHAMRRLASEGRNTLTKDDLLFGARLEQEGIFVKESKPKIGFFANC